MLLSLTRFNLIKTKTFQFSTTSRATAPPSACSPVEGRTCATRCTRTWRGGWRTACTGSSPWPAAGRSRGRPCPTPSATGARTAEGSSSTSSTWPGPRAEALLNEGIFPFTWNTTTVGNEGLVGGEIAVRKDRYDRKMLLRKNVFIFVFFSIIHTYIWGLPMTKKISNLVVYLSVFNFFKYEYKVILFLKLQLF